MEELSNHILNVSWWDSKSSWQTPFFLLILAVNMLLTLLHSVQELKGRLWRYFGAIAGVAFPNLAGILVFSVGLTGGLWVLAVVGIAGGFPLFEITPKVAMWAVGFLIGGRLSDAWFSHIRLDRKGYRPNPGLASTRLYIFEAMVLLLIFAPGLLREIGWSSVGLGLGVLLFFVVLPLLRILRTLPKLRRDPWLPANPPPAPAPLWFV